jgi:hypothetical protein
LSSPYLDEDPPQLQPFPGQDSPAAGVTELRVAQWSAPDPLIYSQPAGNKPAYDQDENTSPGIFDQRINDFHIEYRAHIGCEYLIGRTQNEGENQQDGQSQ